MGSALLKVANQMAWSAYSLWVKQLNHAGRYRKVVVASRVMLIPVGIHAVVNLKMLRLVSTNGISCVVCPAKGKTATQDSGRLE